VPDPLGMSNSVPAVGRWVAVTGVSAVIKVGDAWKPSVKPRSLADVVVCSP
jgi:hypothetical protein